MTETDKLARILRNRADTGCAVHGQQWAEGMRCAANIIEHESASAQPASAADGWVTVPREPTKAMCDAAFDAPTTGHPETATSSFDDIYRAMIAAAPQPPSAMAQESGDGE